MPELTLSPQAGPKPRVNGGKHISLGNALLLTDFSPSSEIALPCAVMLARQYDGKVTVAHVISPEMYEYTPPGLVAQVRAEIEDYGTRRMQMLLSQAEFATRGHCESWRDLGNPA